MTEPDDAGADESERRRSHASRMFAWLDGLALDGRLGLSAHRVAAAIRRCVNSRSGEARPSQAWIARVLGIDARNVRRGLAELVERGHLEVIAGHGPRSGNRYRPVIRSDLQWPQAGDYEGNSVLIADDKKRTRLPSKQRAFTGQSRPALRTQSAPNEDAECRLSGQTRPPEPLLPSSEPSSGPAVVLPTPLKAKEIRKKVIVTKQHEAVARELTRWAGPETGRDYHRRQCARQVAELESKGVPPEFVLTAFWQLSVEERLPKNLIIPRYLRPLAIERRDEAAQLGDNYRRQIWAWFHYVFHKSKGLEPKPDPSLPSPFH